jgi:glycosyltransferase involved in cell wall biosynthesis
MVTAFASSARSGRKGRASSSVPLERSVHYVNFDEPFGFSVIEAMACGTPVIATRRGSMPELIVDGVNGHIVGSVEEAIEAVLRIDELEPSAVRESVELRFDRDRMVNDYVALYRRVLAGASRMYAQEP